LSEAASQALNAHAWPGNVRELENAIERACILSDTAMLEPQDLGLWTSTKTEPPTFNELDLEGTLSEATERAVSFVERRKISEALKAHDGNKTRAAETLGVSYKTLLTKIKDYNL
jgi:DNA-binding NtrC family response regulator